MSFKKDIGTMFRAIANWFDTDPAIQELGSCAVCELTKIAATLLQEATTELSTVVTDVQGKIDTLVKDVVSKIQSVEADAYTKLQQDVTASCAKCIQNPTPPATTPPAQTKL